MTTDWIDILNEEEKKQKKNDPNSENLLGDSDPEKSVLRTMLLAYRALTKADPDRPGGRNGDYTNERLVPDEMKRIAGNGNTNDMQLTNGRRMNLENAVYGRLSEYFKHSIEGTNFGLKTLIYQPWKDIKDKAAKALGLSPEETEQLHQRYVLSLAYRTGANPLASNPETPNNYKILRDGLHDDMDNIWDNAARQAVCNKYHVSGKEADQLHEIYLAAVKAVGPEGAAPAVVAATPAEAPKAAAAAGSGSGLARAGSPVATGMPAETPPVGRTMHSPFGGPLIRPQDRIPLGDPNARTRTTPSTATPRGGTREKAEKPAAGTTGAGEAVSKVATEAGKVTYKIVNGIRQAISPTADGGEPEEEPADIRHNPAKDRAPVGSDPPPIASDPAEPPSIDPGDRTSKSKLATPVSEAGKLTVAQFNAKLDKSPEVVVHLLRDYFGEKQDLSEFDPDGKELNSLRAPDKLNKSEVEEVKELFDIYRKALNKLVDNIKTQKFETIKELPNWAFIKSLSVPFQHLDWTKSWTNRDPNQELSNEDRTAALDYWNDKRKPGQEVKSEEQIKKLYEQYCKSVEFVTSKANIHKLSLENIDLLPKQAVLKGLHSIFDQDTDYNKFDKSKLTDEKAIAKVDTLLLGLKKPGIDPTQKLMDLLGRYKKVVDDLGSADNIKNQTIDTIKRLPHLTVVAGLEQAFGMFGKSPWLTPWSDAKPQPEEQNAAMRALGKTPGQPADQDYVSKLYAAYQDSQWFKSGGLKGQAGSTAANVGWALLKYGLPTIIAAGTFRVTDMIWAEKNPKGRAEFYKKTAGNVIGIFSEARKQNFNAKRDTKAKDRDFESPTADKRHGLKIVEYDAVKKFIAHMEASYKDRASNPLYRSNGFQETKTKFEEFYKRYQSTDVQNGLKEELADLLIQDRRYGYVLPMKQLIAYQRKLRPEQAKIDYGTGTAQEACIKLVDELLDFTDPAKNPARSYEDLHKHIEEWRDGQKSGIIHKQSTLSPEAEIQISNMLAQCNSGNKIDGVTDARSFATYLDKLIADPPEVTEVISEVFRIARQSAKDQKVIKQGELYTLNEKTTPAQRVEIHLHAVRALADVSQSAKGLILSPRILRAVDEALDRFEISPNPIGEDLDFYIDGGDPDPEKVAQAIEGILKRTENTGAETNWKEFRQRLDKTAETDLLKDAATYKARKIMVEEADTKLSSHTTTTATPAADAKPDARAAVPAPVVSSTNPSGPSPERIMRKQISDLRGEAKAAETSAADARTKIQTHLAASYLVNGPPEGSVCKTYMRAGTYS